MRKFGCLGGGVLVAGVVCVLSNTPVMAFQNNQDAQLRAQARQTMQLRALRQRLNSERNARRVQDSVDRANRGSRRAIRDAKPNRRR